MLTNFFRKRIDTFTATKESLDILKTSSIQSEFLLRFCTGKSDLLNIAENREVNKFLGLGEFLNKTYVLNEYNQYGDLVMTTTQDGVVSYQEYDSKGRPLRTYGEDTTGPDAFDVSHTYDKGKIISTGLMNGNKYRSESVNGTYIECEWKKIGEDQYKKVYSKKVRCNNTLTIVDREGHVIVETYDHEGKLVEKLCPNDIREEYEYDVIVGTKTTTTTDISKPDGNVSHTVHQYDRSGRELMVIKDGKLILQNVYNTDGMLISYRDISGLHMINYDTKNGIDVYDNDELVFSLSRESSFNSNEQGD